MAPARKRRTRNQSPSNSEIVAPGGGTQADVNSLANSLGLGADAVSDILNCEGSGVAPARRSRSSVGAVAGTAPVTSSAWADFMADGDEAGKTPATATTTAAATGSSAKRAKTEEAVESKQSSSTVREYKLPVMTRMSAITPGVLAQTGTLDAKIVGRTKRPLTEAYDLQEPTVLAFESSFNKQPVAAVITSSSATHSIAITKDGSAYSWGRNEAGQCGFGDTSGCVPLPKKIELAGKFVGGAVGKAHSVLIDESGVVYAVGANKYGQCGVNSSNEAVLNWRKCSIVDADGAKIVQAACGENFTVLLDADGIVYSAGLNEFGQLGNGETGEYFIAANKIGFANASKFERRSVFVHKPGDTLEDSKKPPVPLPDSDNIRIGSISCGKHHTVAVEASLKATSIGSQRVFTWGCGGYGVLGHGVQVDEYTPHLIKALVGPLFNSNSPVRASAGAHCSMVLTENGHVYYCGKHRSVGEATMRPALIDILANNMHVVTALDGGAQTVFCSTSNGVTVSWGMGLTGELGYGANNPKSCSKPKFVEKLDKCLITDVACGYGHTLFIISNEDAEDKKLLKTIAKIEAGDMKDFIKKCK